MYPLSYKLSVSLCIYNFIAISLLFVLEACQYHEILTDPLSLLVFIGEILVFYYAPYKVSQTMRKWDVISSLMLGLMGAFIFTTMIYFFFGDEPRPFFLF